MSKEKVIMFLVLAILMVVSSPEGKPKTEVTDKSAGHSTTNVADKNNRDTAQDPAKTKTASGKSGTSLRGKDVPYVSLIQLIANPEKFHGKYVRVVGFVNLEFEGDAIYLHEDDYKYGLTKNGLWLTLSGEQDIRKFDRKYVLVQGTFNAKDQGHGDLFSGAVENIKRFEVWVVKRAQYPPR